MSGLPSWISFEDKGSGIGELSGVPSNADVRKDIDIRFQVEDKVGAKVNQVAVLKVVNENNVPSFNFSPNESGKQGILYEQKIDAEDLDLEIPNSTEEIVLRGEGLPQW